MRPLELRDGTTVITGAAAGMGAEIARRLAADDVRLALIDHDAAGLDALGLPESVATRHVVDLRDDAAVAACAAEIVSAHPSITALITCAGSSMLGSLEQLTLEEMRWLVDVNLWGTVSITKALLPAMLRSPAAHITHLASVYALAAPAGRIPYAMSKFAVRGFSEALRHELEDTAVTVGAVYPAGVRTGIILHGRYAAALDPAIAARAAAAQAAMYHTDPSDAAATIIRATVRRRARTMVGREAGLIDALVRVLPVRHWNLMRRPLRAATDTTTPVG
ncbi:SDR family NAD(P)-dependent oxidoreductase [Microbacterium sp. NPDC055903]